MNRVLNGSERLYRLLILLYPPGMRRRFGRDMAELFRDRLRQEWRSRGRLGLLRTWRRTLTDLLWHALMERCQEYRQRSRQPAPQAGRAGQRQGGNPFFGGLGRDLHYALRTLLRHPASSLLILLTLALGVGANAAMFGLADRLLLSPPPHIQEADQVLRIQFQGSDRRGNPFTMSTTSYPVFESLKQAAHGFVALAAEHGGEMVLERGSASRKLKASMVSADYFTLLGVEPQLGRFPGPEENRLPDGLAVAVLSQPFWQREFGGDRGVLGSTLRLDGRLYSVVGVAPGGFSGDDLNAVDVWVPLPAGLAKRSDDWRFESRLRIVSILGRLAEQASPEAAQQEAQQILRESGALPRRGPEFQVRLGSVIPGRQLEGVTRQGRIALWLSGTAALVFLIALANVATLQLLKALRRRRQTALRLSLGCSRGQLARQLLAESLLLAVLGGAAGLLVAVWFGEAVRRLLIPEMASVGWAQAGILAAAGGAALLAGLATGLVSAWQSRSVSLMEGLQSAGSTLRWRRSRLQTGLLVAQAGLSLLLLAGAGLFLRSLYEVVSQDLGFDTSRLALLEIEFPASVPASERDDIYRRLQEQASRHPDVASALPVNSVPFGPFLTLPVGIPGRDVEPLFMGQFPRLYGTAPGFFKAMRMEIAEGRAFSGADHAQAPLVAVVNRSMASTVWPDENPLGQCLRSGFDPVAWPPQLTDKLPCRRVVGVVADTRPRRIRLEEETTSLQYYLPFVQLPALPGPPMARTWSLLIETKGPAAEHLAGLHNALGKFLPRSQSEHLEFRPYQQLIDPQIRPFRLGATLFSLFGGLALTMAAVGLYGVLAYSVAQRRGEIGVRLALGAGGPSVARLIAGEGFKVALTGILLGAAAALAAGRLVASQLYRTEPHDPVVLLGAAAALTGAALLASFVPAWRASRTDPNEVLRTE